MNKNYCKTDGESIIFAPMTVEICGRIVTAPTDADYIEAGWYRNAIAAPTPEAGYMVESVRYEVHGEAVYAAYTYALVPTPVTRYSKLRIYGAIASLGAWQTVEDWLKAKDINGINGWMAFQLAQDIADDHPLFAPLANEAKALLGLGDEQFEAFLAKCRLED